MASGTFRGRRGAHWAQAFAQVLTVWAFVLAVMSRPGFGLESVFMLAYVALAVVLPLRNDGTSRDKAVCCFAASMVLASALALQLWGIVTGFTLTPVQALTLTSAVLFSLAGGLHWVRREADAHGGTHAGASA